MDVQGRGSWTGGCRRYTMWVGIGLGILYGEVDTGMGFSDVKEPRNAELVA